MKYLCKCGNETSIVWYSFQQGKRCGGSKRLTYNFVKDEFQKAGCKLLETEYTNNNNTLMKYSCSCGNIGTIIWNKFQQGVRCMKCSGNKALTTRKLNFDVEFWIYTPEKKNIYSKIII